MNKNHWISVGLAAILGGCASATETGMLAREPFAVATSAKERDQIASCLLDRLSSSDMRGIVEQREGETLVKFRSVTGTYYWLFLIQDSGAGSTIEMRRMSSLTAGRTNAETCF